MKTNLTTRMLSCLPILALAGFLLAQLSKMYNFYEAANGKVIEVIIATSLIIFIVWAVFVAFIVGQIKGWK